MAIESKVVEWLDNATTAGRRIYLGTRLQTSSLPAITFDVQEARRAVLGLSSIVCEYQVTLNAVATTAAEALTVAAAAREALRTVGGVDGASVVCTVLERVQDPQPENGDEAYLYIASNQNTIYFAGP
jgi:hypothetical protein